VPASPRPRLPSREATSRGNAVCAGPGEVRRRVRTVA
jgi:hypothetical protein